MTESPDAEQTSVAEDSPGFWRTQEMLLVQQVMSHVGKDLTLEKPFREMLHLMSELLGLNRGRIVLPDPERGDYAIKYSYGLTMEERDRGRYAPGEGITGRVLANKQLIIVQDIDREPDFLARAVTRAQLPQETVSFIAMPINVEGKGIGVLACHRLLRRRRTLSDDVSMLRILATLTGQLLQLKSAVEQKTKSLEQHNAMLAKALESATPRYGIIGTSSALLRAIGQLEQVASSNATVLLLGESGTGKELFARALHLASTRHDMPFIKVNCAAIPEGLFESELFGHERGAFTGAMEARAGLFEQAKGGTIFLDEIGELPLGMQAKLLRTIQEGTISRLGAKRETKIDVRLVAATNRDLQKEIGNGRFREDLYYRLNVIPVRLPALRDRREDIPLLIGNFVSRVNQTNQRNVNLTTHVVEYLASLSWPGNIRQLSNLIERLVLLASSSLVELKDVVPIVAEAMEHEPKQADVDDVGEGDENSGLSVRPYGAADSHSADTLQSALRKQGGNKSRAAQALGLTARQFAYRWKKLGLD
jgi:Nif-specific regulatory protein